jgi:hypothetical protein
MFESVKEFFVDFWNEEPELLLLFAFIFALCCAIRWATKKKRHD